MSKEPNQRFFENTDGLAEAEAISSSSADMAVLRIDNLERRLAVTIAHELTKRLDALGATGNAYNDTNYKLTNSLTSADKKHIHGEQKVFDSLPAHGNFKVEVKLPERAEMEKVGAQLGKYSIVASVDLDKDEIRDDESSLHTRETLQAGYESVFSRVDFFPTEEQMDIERQLLKVGVPVRANTRQDSEVFEEEAFNDTKNVARILRNIGVKNINLDQLDELCEIKKWDPVTVIDLYIEVITDKQKKGHTYPEITLTDLVQQANYSRAKDIRERHEKLLEGRFKKIGLDAEEVKRRYDFYEGDENSRLAFRFASWIVSRNFFSGENEELTNRFNMGERIPTPKLFKEITAGVYRAYTRFQAERHESFNLGVDWQKLDYQRGMDYHTNLILLCFNIFYGKDISSFRKVE